jgi:hypothetical protein
MQLANVAERLSVVCGEHNKIFFSPTYWSPQGVCGDGIGKELYNFPTPWGTWLIVVNHTLEMLVISDCAIYAR